MGYGYLTPQDIVSQMFQIINRLNFGSYIIFKPI